MPDVNFSRTRDVEYVLVDAHSDVFQLTSPERNRVMMYPARMNHKVDLQLRKKQALPKMSPKQHQRSPMQAYYEC